MQSVDVIIIGAGAAGLMCAIEAGKRKRSTLILEKSNKPGKKILMSGGGYCNFTNYHIDFNKYISHNPHFCKSALSRYTQWDFIGMVEKYNIEYYEKKLGQLFCTHKSKEILNLLLSQCEHHHIPIYNSTQIQKVDKAPNHRYLVTTPLDTFCCESLVIASGALSIPSLGSSSFGYQLAKQFDLHVWPTRAGLVPLTLHEKDKQDLSLLSGVSFDSLVSNERIEFRENSLCTHRGLSGPAILQLSSYWLPGEAIDINLLPKEPVTDLIQRHQDSKKQLKSILGYELPKRLIETRLSPEILNKPCFKLTSQDLEQLTKALHTWTLYPNGTEGYRTAEVTLGGVDCNELSSKTMETINHPGLYFIGEVVDVTGWLGGYNFQWAWSSGYAAGQVV
jgi:predicted Rossmann fold flavoprotein